MADLKDNLAYDAKSTISSDTLTPASEGMLKYNVYYTTSRLNATLHEGKSSTPASYYLQSNCALTKCLLYLRRGNAKTSPMVAFAKMPIASRHMQIAKGDYQQQKASEGQIVWDELHRAENSFRRSDYQFSVAEGGDGKREEFDWRKDRAKCAATVYDCLDGSGRTVARLLSGGALNWKKGGEVEVLEGLDEGVRERVILSAMTIWFYEALCYQSWLKGYGGSGENAKKD
ncbi:MAG: hypothetical protein Q9195_004523 [Heterodermia aff. obscurata]